jgi:hypothetical protein
MSNCSKTILIKKRKAWAISPNNKLSVQPTAHICINFTLNVTKNNFTLSHSTCQMCLFVYYRLVIRTQECVKRTEWLYICLVQTDALKNKKTHRYNFLMDFRKGRNKWNYLAADIHRSNIMYIKYTSVYHTIPANSKNKISVNINTLFYYINNKKIFKKKPVSKYW